MPTTRLDAAYSAQIKSIRLRLQTFALARFNAGQYRDVDLAKFIEQVTPVILAGRQQVAQLTDTYLTMQLQAMLGTKVPFKPPIDTSKLRGVDVTEVYARPFVTVRTKLAQGLTYDAAVQAGAARVMDLVATDMQMAKTHSANKVFTNSPIQFYKRVLTGSKSCALCLIASTQHYRVKDLMPIHPGCDCGVEPLAPDTPRTWANDGSSKRVIDPNSLGLTHDQVESFTGTYSLDGRAPDYRKLVVVHEHGEIGPVLALKGQKFTGPSVAK
jgi:hypothetical protein